MPFSRRHTILYSRKKMVNFFTLDLSPSCDFNLNLQVALNFKNVLIEYKHIQVKYKI